MSTDGRRASFLVVPIACVTAAAMFGQVGFFHDQAAPGAWPDLARWGLAVWIAGTAETISLYIGWHAHDALLRQNHRAAFRRRLASYALALVVAGINYWHFSDAGHPTPLAVIFALFSALSPWLWGMHTRRAVDIRLVAEGLVDRSGARFASDKWKHFPIRAWRARRYSILYNIDDPRAAWEGFEATRLADASRREAVRSTYRADLHAAAGGSPVRALLVRIAGVIAPPPTGLTSGAARGGVTPGMRSGGATVPMRPETVAAEVERRSANAAGAPPAPVDRLARDRALQETATRWALAHDARREPIPGWRPILREFEDRGLSEHRAKEAAKAAQQRAAGSTTVGVGPATVMIRNGAPR